MTRQIFVNLPVTDLPRSMAFYKKLGFAFNPAFTNDQAACLVIGTDSFAMLGVRSLLQTFTKKPIADPRTTTTALVSISCASRDEVDRLVAIAKANGGSASEASDDQGFMYSHDFDDPDGNSWGVFHMVDTPEATK
jgi:predicted lactoylglutathione lyase